MPPASENPCLMLSRQGWLTLAEAYVYNTIIEHLSFGTVCRRRQPSSKYHAGTVMGLVDIDHIDHDRLRSTTAFLVHSWIGYFITLSPCSQQGHRSPKYATLFCHSALLFGDSTCSPFGLKLTTVQSLAFMQRHLDFLPLPSGIFPRET